MYEYEVYKCLSAVNKTASGPDIADNTPYWLFKHLAMELTPVVTHIINLTLTYGRPRYLWKRAIITPVPKIPHPTELSDFCPISVTPLLSRIVERVVVKKFLLPFLPTISLRISLPTTLHAQPLPVWLLLSTMLLNTWNLLPLSAVC